MGRKRSSFCSKCNKPKNKKDFYRNNGSWDGLFNYCKECCKANAEKYYLEKKKQIKQSNKNWYWKDEERSHRRSRTYYRKNRAKILQRMQERYWNDPKRLEKQKKKNHVRRARANGSMGFVDNNEWQKILKIYGDKCLACGKKDNIVADHVIPLSRGGKNSFDNIQPLCGSCNSRKHVKIIDYRL